MNATNIPNKPFESFFDKFRKYSDYLWPIERYELTKFLTIALLMFCILFIQNLIRALKDSIINTMIGTEAVSFLKFWGVLPAAFLITILYIKLVNVMKGEKIFYLISSSFLIFFALFAFYIFPNYQNLHFSPATIQTLTASYPNLKWFIIIISNWSFALFYIIAELWPNAMYGLLFWQFVNTVITVEESKRFYPLFGLFGQCGLYLSGNFLMNIPLINSYATLKLNLQSSENCVTVQIILSLAIALGLIALLSFWLLNNKILFSESATKIDLQYRIKTRSLGLKESFQMICSSRYIMLITTMLICYGIAINLVEGPWKAEVSKIYTTPTEYTAFVGQYLYYTFFCTILFVIIGSNIVRKFGWFATAMITPIILFSTGMIFFVTVGLDQYINAIIAHIVYVDTAFIAITIGAVQNVLSKSSKYTLFDSTKEMVYVPLNDELKSKGKAAADVIGIKLGKASSALIQSMIFIIVPSATYHSIALYLMLVFMVVCSIWMWAVFKLSKEYKETVLTHASN